ncbi:hypothetical protein A3D80_04170 [Candidatus Roizmanbacteria bacterium RIFCSPHIGHO2_02_FULL_40_13b]|uniref:EamA domain-containing protein n=1 Tax=Candidatus Roizmanbacteria bacterium RIFCSPHIGHO2_01_FULL_39_24 TaxID=1802032 RepID=A0A1F7GLI6_9BACT|nr:MAG: hypothetical protein A2799_00255 [Candidatus Roizmanbacteria bacterium RIFCSPHIGHO2_01_FULL_39_24]OGK27987.1 MAG: hypothetical protein A3D80_04170 [Candidatus Roizmanbacteria bacterium RIFCSPHIGHO2_02_FULL_40_13b]OGK49221.1 MAG: hypothetical protein A3A56_04465 [Candidatus Roizmanbacteria bacterium RIFCSPLOWO2_01_FULL_40_32]OGK57192.1 MAG: hypothetical protein A3H83_02985 [Candidatus Roizmanbacteria bacterium RIFCSPLOWO2_02_FULL_39_8]
MQGKSEREKGIIAVIVLSAVIASMGLFARVLGTKFTPLQQVYLRIGAAFILSIVLFYKNLDFGKLKRVSMNEWALLVVRSAATYLLGVTLFSISVGMAKISTISFIGALPIVALLGVLILKEKLTAQKLIYLIVGLAGVLLISVQDYSNIFSWGTGEILALISSIFLSLGFVLRRKHGNLLNNYEMSTLMFFISTTLLIATSFMLHEELPSITTWSTLIITTVIGAGIANVAYLFLSNYGFQKIEAVLANNLLIISPLFAITLGLLFYKELPTLKELMGGALIIFSAYGMNKILD